MIPDFSPPPFAASATVRTVSDLRAAVTKVNSWVSYVNSYMQTQLLPPLNNSTAITPTAASSLARVSVDLIERVEALEREVAALKERLNGG